LCLTLWFAASVPKDILPAEYGYSLPLPRSLLMYGLGPGLAQIAAAVAVQALRWPHSIPVLALRDQPAFSHCGRSSRRSCVHSRCFLGREVEPEGAASRGQLIPFGRCRAPCHAPGRDLGVSQEPSPTRPGAPTEETPSGIQLGQPSSPSASAG